MSDAWIRGLTMSAMVLLVLHAVGLLPTLAAGAWMMAIEGLSVGSLGQVAGTATAPETHP